MNLNLSKNKLSAVKKLSQLLYYLIAAINCTDPPVAVDATGLTLMNWTEEVGNPRPYDTLIQVDF